MSAPPLNEAALISDGARFYNPAEAISPVVEATPETKQSVSPPQNKTRHKLHILEKMADSLCFVITRYKARIDSLQREVELLKEAKSRLEFKNDGLKRDIREVERSYANIKAQKDSLKAELDN
ncbi:uncharacterized protein K444DRAFT_705374 [Hyaloscypha bicolor E]|uniref:Uncharacterized protein n=1 Tax=Hyaloscypha bicolor E TaxID=1095630 RepID=A0A2J6TPD1_9HELO|nr:uncharacterized protein K444DRAFT_705374 [Hyaloscypha bicolor E]PMD64808.1 hypothetical protein K444DRAFT_705374 [Hyaloscypha bicolor E]